MNTPALPVLGPLFTALFLVVWWKPSRARRVVTTASLLAQLAVAGGALARTLSGETLVLGVGNWTLRMGIVLALDPLGALMVVLSTAVVLLAILYGCAESPTDTEHPLRQPLMMFLLTGINLSFCTGDLFNLFVGFEVMLISSYTLLTLEADNWEIKQAYPYLSLNLVGSTLFLCAAGFTYAMAGTLNFAELHDRLASMGGDPRLPVLAFLLVAVFALKAGVFPLYYWLPHSYPTLATPLAAVYAGLLTKVGVYVLLRLMGTVLPHDLAGIHASVAALAGATLVAGSMGALSRGIVRGMLAFQVIAAVGFMLLPLGWFTTASVAACVFYLMQDAFVKAGLFLTTGVAARLSRSDHLKHMGGLASATPWTAAVFLTLALSLAGVPPLSGFWGKLAIVQAGLSGGRFGGVAIVLAASVLTLVAMLRIWHNAFWKAAPGAPPDIGKWRWRRMAWVSALTAVVCLGAGLYVEPFYRAARITAERLLDAPGYVDAVRSLTGKESR